MHSGHMDLASFLDIGSRPLVENRHVYGFDMPVSRSRSLLDSLKLWCVAFVNSFLDFLVLLLLMLSGEIHHPLG